MVMSGTSGSWETLSTTSFPSGIDSPETIKNDTKHSKQDRLTFLEKKIDLMLSCYVDGIKNEMEAPYMHLNLDTTFRKSLLNPDDLLTKITWLEREYTPLRDRVLAREIPTDDDDFEIILTSCEILYDDVGKFRLGSLYTQSNECRNEEKLDEMGKVLVELYDATRRIRFGGRIRDYMVEFLTLVGVDPRVEDRISQECPEEYSQIVERYEGLLIVEFERDDTVKNRLKRLYDVDNTTQMKALILKKNN